MYLLPVRVVENRFQDRRPWHDQVIDYLRENRNVLYNAIDKIPGLAMDLPEATYLAWIDTRKLELEHPVAFFERAGVGLSDGAEFEGRGFVRLNYGCSRATLLEAIRRIRNAVKDR